MRPRVLNPWALDGFLLWATFADAKLHRKENQMYLGITTLCRTTGRTQSMCAGTGTYCRTPGRTIPMRVGMRGFALDTGTAKRIRVNMKPLCQSMGGLWEHPQNIKMQPT